ncbi:MAG: DUF47 family protein [Candidatus Gastranaerophilales bacterium]|nr:DUF47 family protein [Candidatus Gastranaerophilales bacterium]
MKYNIFEKLLPPKNTVFYDCFEAAAKNCYDMAGLFNEALLHGITDEKMVKARTLKHRGSGLERETINKLNTTFVTPIDREDIQMLAIMLNKITKKISQAFMNLNVYRVSNYTEEMFQQAKTIVKATDELMRSVGLLKTISRITEITTSYESMKEIETLGDDILHRAMDKLFSGEFEAIEVIKLRDIYKVLESALDKCFSVSDVILGIALKNN